MDQTVTTNLETIRRQKNVLSSKEKLIKDSLFGTTQTLPKPSKIARQSQPKSAQGQYHTPNDSGRFSGSQQTPSKIDQGSMNNFMDDLTGQMTKMGQTNMSHNLLSSQNQVLQQHSKILNENQKVISKLIQTQQKSQTHSSSDNSNIIAELLKPISTQIDDIKNLYDATKDSAGDVAAALTEIRQYQKFNTDAQTMKISQGKFTQNYASFMRNQQDLRGNFNKVDEELTKFKQEKLEMFSDFDVEICIKNIQRLKSTLIDLEDRSSRGQTELENKINAVNKRYNLMLPSTYIDLINKNVLKIDLLKSKNDV